MEKSVPIQIRDLLDGMLARPEYQFPVVAAQEQYRDRYYGLSAAAMLEDLFFDAISNFISTVVPGSSIARPPRGEKGWDYAINGNKVSHKVSKAGPIEIAALWDATRTDIKSWTFEYPISFSNGGYSPKKLTARIEGTNHEVKMAPIARGSSLKKNDRILLVRWPNKGSAEVIHSWDVPIDGETSSWLAFRLIWPQVMKLVNSGCPANHIELMSVTATRSTVKPDIGDSLTFDSCHRPGIFILDPINLKDLAVKTNNRAVLVDRTVVGELMKGAYENELFVPMPIWFAVYAGDRPPDLYLAQRAEFDTLFSRFSGRI